MHRFLTGALLALLGASAGCGPTLANHIRADQLGLGKVVVYRNGVAYYERHARVKGGTLTVSVPRDRVDDFLKSLTVVDAATQEPLPVAFPRQQSADGATIEMTLTVPNRPGEADVRLTYVTEAPAWKPSYRLAMGEGGQMMLEAWAVVDNVSGEDWDQVEVGVGSSAAMSFRYDLWGVRTVDRAELAPAEQFAVAPPTAVSPYGGSAAPTTTVIDLAATELRAVDNSAVLDGDYAKNVATGRTFESVLGGVAGNQGDAALGGSTAVEGSYIVDGVNTTGLDDGEAKPEPSPSWDDDEDPAPAARADSGRRERAARVPRPPPPPDPAALARAAVASGDRKLASAIPALIAQKAFVVVEGYAAPGEPDGDSRALARANLVRNQLIDAGVAPARVRAVSRGIVPGRGAGVQLVTGAPGEGEGRAAASGVAAVDPGAPPVGESYFLSPGTLTVGRGTSAMVSVLRKETEGQLVYLYDPSSQRGNQRFAFRAVRMDNPTGATLEPGPITVYGQGRYVGEGLTEPILPHAAAVIPFALDRQVVVDRETGGRDRLERLASIQRGVLTADVQHVRTTTLTLTSRLPGATTVYVRHPVTAGWTLVDPPGTVEKIGDAYLIAIPLAAGATRAIEIAEETPTVQVLDLAADPTLSMLAVFVASDRPSPALKAKLTAILDLHRALVDGGARIELLRQRIDEFRDRGRELEGQIVGLRKVKHAGELQRSLQQKLDDTATRGQQATLDLVAAQEELMLTRVRFADALAEFPDREAIAAAP